MILITILLNVIGEYCVWIHLEIVIIFLFTVLDRKYSAEFLFNTWAEIQIHLIFTVSSRPLNFEIYFLQTIYLAIFTLIFNLRIWTRNLFQIVNQTLLSSYQIHQRIHLHSLINIIWYFWHLYDLWNSRYYLAANITIYISRYKWNK